MSDDDLTLAWMHGYESGRDAEKHDHQLREESAVNETKMQRLVRVVAYAKSLGFTNAHYTFWEKGYEEYGLCDLSDAIDVDYNVPMCFSIGISLDDEVCAVHFASDDENDTEVFDTEEEARKRIDAFKENTCKSEGETK